MKNHVGLFLDASIKFLGFNYDCMKRNFRVILGLEYYCMKRGFKRYNHVTNITCCANHVAAAEISGD